MRGQPCSVMRTAVLRHEDSRAPSYGQPCSICAYSRAPMCVQPCSHVRTAVLLVYRLYIPSLVYRAVHTVPGTLPAAHPWVHHADSRSLSARGLKQSMREASLRRALGSISQEVSGQERFSAQSLPFFSERKERTLLGASTLAESFNG